MTPARLRVLAVCLATGSLAAQVQGPLVGTGRPTTWIHTKTPVANDTGGALINGDFHEGLTGWLVDESGGSALPGTVTAIAERAVLREGDSFLISLVQEFMVPREPDRFSFTFEAIAGFDRSAAGIPDAFEVHLLDQNLQPVVPAWAAFATSFFNVQEDGTVLRGATTTWDGLTATVDVRHLTPGTRITVFVDLIGADGDFGGEVRVDDFCLTTCPGNQPPIQVSGPVGNRVKTSVGNQVSFSLGFGPPELTQDISSIQVDARGLANFRTDPPVLGPQGSITCYFTPNGSQVTSPLGVPHRVTITAFDSCTTPLGVSVDVDLEVCTCATAATTSTFGRGWAGTQGTPTLTATALANACDQASIHHSNSSGTLSCGCMLVGMVRTVEQTGWGGTLYINMTDPTFVIVAHELPIGGTTVEFPVPCGEASLCGVSLYSQAVQFDAGATDGVAFTAGLELVVGS